MIIELTAKGQIFLKTDAGVRYESITPSWRLGRDIRNSANANYFYASPNGDSGGGVVIDKSLVTGIIKSGVTTNVTGWTHDQLFNELTDNFFLKGGGNGSGVTSDYVISKNGNIYYASSFKKDLVDFQSANLTTVIQSAVNALIPKGGGAGSAGGKIFFNLNEVNLSNQVIVDGWEGIIEADSSPYSQLIFQGKGLSTKVVQNTTDQNGFVIKNCASVCFLDMQIFAGANAKSCILGDDTGDLSEMSFYKSLFSNVICTSQNPLYHAVEMKNFFDCNIESLDAYGVGGSLLLHNTSTTTGYGNSKFGYIRTNAGSGKNGITFKSSNSDGAHSINQLTFLHHENHSGKHAVYASSLNNSVFVNVDYEATSQPIHFEGSNTEGKVLNNKFLQGYLLPDGGGNKTAIYCNGFAGGNEFNLKITGNGDIIPIKDEQQYILPNSYNMVYESAIDVSKVSITESEKTPYKYISSNGAVAYERLVKDTYSVTPSIGDSSKKVANTEFVSSAISALGNVGAGKRTVFIETQGGNTTVTLVGLSSNGQGTATSRAIALTNYYTRQRKVGRVGATTANANAGELGNQQFNVVDGFVVKLVFGIQAYNAGHQYSIGMGGFYSNTTLPSTLNDSIHIFADPGDTNFKLRSASGSIINLGSNFPCNTSGVDLYEVTFTVPANSTTGLYSVKRLNTGNVATGILTEVPAGLLAHKCVASNYATGVAPSIDISRISITTDV